MIETKIIESLHGMKVLIDSVSLDPDNVRKHDESQLSKLKGALSIYGQVSPIVVQRSTNVIRKGNATWLAAKELGWTEIAVVYVDMDDTTARAYAIADNRLSELSEWNLEGLSDSLKLLEEADYDLASLGWDGDELLVLKDWKPEVLEIEEDDVPPLAEKAVSQLGDLWLLGEHRVLCGDSTNAAEVESAMKGKKAQLVFTDPPYGVGYVGGTTAREKMVGDESTDLYTPCCLIAMEYSDNKAPFYLWHAGVKGLAAAAAAMAAGYEIRCVIIWNKNLAQFGALSAQYKQKHEPCYYCFKKGIPPRWYGPTNEVTVWDCDRSASNDFHPTQKPVALAHRAITNSTAPGDIVLDGFLGSGSTIIAAEQLGRKCYGLEIECRHVDVIVKRWQEFTKRDATLDGTDKTFEVITAERNER